MASISKKAKTMGAAVAGIPKVAQAIMAIPAEHRGRALDAAERSYLQTARDLGCAEAVAQRWLSSVMFRLRREIEKRRVGETELLKNLYKELIPAGSRASKITDRRRAIIRSVAQFTSRILERSGSGRAA
jgi:hypothetical protein